MNRSYKDVIQRIRTNPEIVLAPLTLVVVLILWQVIVTAFDVPMFVLPPLERVFHSLRSGLLEHSPNDPGGYIYHAIYTVWEALLAFLIGSISGIVVGAVVVQWPLVERTVYPYIIAFQALPKIAVAPLLLIWFGFGITSKIVVGAIVCFFPLLVNTIAGISSVEQERIDMARSLCASKMQIFRKVIFPSALPFIFAGLNMAAVMSMLAVLIGEFIGAQRGLGLLLMQMNFTLDVAGTFAVLIILGVIGIALHLIIRRIERRVVFWIRIEETLGI
jgi:NitT/TauT family transport system permease protein